MIETRRLQRLFDRVWETRKDCDFADVRRLLVAIGFPQRNPVGWAYVDDVIDAVKEILERGKKREEEDR